MKKLEQVKPKWYQVKPTFDFGLKYPCPYIWFAWWLITWDVIWWKRFNIPTNIQISYLPD